MKKWSYREERRHGAPDFPMEYYHIDKGHPRYEMNLHWHREFEIVRVLEGTLALYLNNEEYRLGAGQVCFVGSGVLHRAEPRDCMYECVVLDLNMLTRHGPDRVTGHVLSFLKGEVENHPVSGDMALLRAVDALFDALRRQEPFFELAACGAVLQVLHWLHGQGWVRPSEREKHAGHRRETMAALLEWIEENYTERITLKALAEVAKTNEKYLCRFFKEYTGNSPIEYVNRLRVERACLAMSERHCTVTEAAMDNGFNDLSYFCKIFKRYKGVGPREYLRIFAG